MKFHWKVLTWMLAGALVGLAMQAALPAPAITGATWATTEEGVEVASASGPAAKAGLAPGTVVRAVVLKRGSEQEERVEVRTADELESREDVRGEVTYGGVVSRVTNGEVIWLEDDRGGMTAVTLTMDPASPRAAWIRPFDMAARLFMALLKMLIVPLVMASIITGVAGVGTLSDLRRLGVKTFAWYIATSLLAVLLGQMLVNLIRPGDGAVLGLSPVGEAAIAPDAGFGEILLRMVPPNVVSAMGDNGAMLSLIFFSLLFGFFVTQVPQPHGERMRGFFDSLFQVMLKMAEGILKLLPYGVFCLLVRVVAKTGFAVFEPLLLYMFTVTLALLLHALVTLPVLIRSLGGISPRRWFQAMSPALLTAFSTSSSSMTLPVTMETVEKRGKVSNRVTSFTLPLGATINMDGTALYECVGVIFLAQYYQSAGGFELTLTMQAMVVVMALMASIGAAGIPSAGLVMMLTILSALGLPLEGAALLLAVDRPLDMLRTAINVWSDSAAAAVVARSEGEEGPLSAGAPG
jgi:Na+/H+-dicarboxylate symporter